MRSGARRTSSGRARRASRASSIIFGNRFPTYELFLIAVGPIVLLILWLLFQKTRWGTLVRAATQDREMVGALGVNQRLLFTSVFAFGSMLAGLAARCSSRARP